ncbi:MAG: hypothetical protein ACPF8V_11490 [Luteibaculum sp.]
MRIVEVLITGFLLIALCFKIMHWPYTGILLISSFGLYAAYLCPFQLWEYRKVLIHKSEWLFALLSTLVMSLFPIAVLFNFLHLPAAGYVLMASVVSLFIVFILSWIAWLKLNTKARAFAKRSFYRCTIYFGVGLYYFFLQYRRYG